jgi:hypothetical protein
METVVVLLFWTLLFHGVPAGESIALFALTNGTLHGLVAPVAWVDVLVSRVRLPDRAAVLLTLAAVGAWGRA